MALPENCPLCNAGREKQKVVTSHVYGQETGEGRAFFYCEACDVRYQYPRLTQEEEECFYSAKFEDFMASRAGHKDGWQHPEDHLSAHELTRQRRMKYLSPYLKDQMNLLEVGCSSGFMLFPFAQSGHNCFGIEPSGIFSEFVRNRGLKVYESMSQMLQIMPGAEFDLIMHFFVLEHIADPGLFLKQQLDLLKPGGKIIFEIPNVADPLFSVYNIPAFERFYWSIAHHWYFSEDSLNYLLRQLGVPYEICLDQRYDLSNHMIWARDGLPGGIGRFTDLIGSEMEELYKQALIRIRRCDTLIAILSKN